MTTTDDPAVPNHHAHYRTFSGFGGLIAALTMTVGRGDQARLAARLCGLEPGDVVIDVGCGPGAAARNAARVGAAVTGIDPAPVMLQTARRLSFRTSGVRYLEGAAEALPLPDEMASVLWSIASVHHWPDVDGGLQEAHRVLGRGGRLVAIERRVRPGAHGLASHGWTDEQAAAFADRCLANGFLAPHIERQTHGRKPSVAVLVTRS